MDNQYTQSQMIVLGAVFIVIPTIFVGLRVWARFLSRACLSWDDYTVFLALIFNYACCILQLVAAIDGQLGQHQSQLPNGMPDLADPRFAVYEKSKFALQIFSVLGEGAIKSAVALLYIRIFSVRKYRIAVQVVLILTVGWTISLFFATLFQCYPITAFVESIYENTCVDTEALWYAVSISDIIFDFILLIIPIPVILGLQLPWKEKVGVIFMFLLGGLASASSIIRLVIFHRVFGELAIHFNDETYYTSPVFFWSAIEVWLGVIAVCLPTLRPVFKRVHVLATTGSRGADSYDSMDGASKLRDGGQAKHTGIRSKDYSKLTYGGGSQIDSGDLEMLDGKYPSNFSVRIETSTVTDDAVAFPEGAIVIQHNLSQHSYNQERV